MYELHLINITINQFFNKSSLFYNILKIIIIVFVSFTIFANFQQFSTGGDSQQYGYWAINFAKGEYELKNELLEQSGSVNFVPNNFRQTQFDSLVPSGNIGIYVFGAISFITGGYYGLFYFGPILATLLLILSERIGTNLFGKLAGLITLIIVSTDLIIFNTGNAFGTDTVFTLFTLLGCFFLIKFLTKNSNNKNILLCSTFLSMTAFFRMNGIIFFPAELLILSGFFVFQFYKTNTKQNFVKFVIKKIRDKKCLKFIFLLIIPWLVFFSFFASYNNYYFGDPTTTYRDARCQIVTCPDKGNLIFSFFKFDSDRIEWLKYYSIPLIPDEFKKGIENSAPSNTEKILGNNWLSIMSFIIIVGILIYSIKNKNKPTEIIVIISFIAVTLSFFSMSYIAPSSFSINPDIQDRYMMSNVPLSSLLIGYFLSSVFVSKATISLRGLKINKKYLRKSVVVLIIIFLIFSIYGSKPMDKFMDKGFFYKNPQNFAKKYPVASEGVSENNIIIDHRGRKSLEYGAIAFNWAIGDRNSTFQNLKMLLEKNYDVFAFKKYYTSSNTDSFLHSLESNQGIIVKDHSKTFCKLMIIDSPLNIENQTKSDNSCFRNTAQDIIIEN